MLSAFLLRMLNAPMDQCWVWCYPRAGIQHRSSCRCTPTHCFPCRAAKVKRIPITCRVTFLMRSCPISFQLGFFSLTSYSFPSFAVYLYLLCLFQQRLLFCFNFCFVFNNRKFQSRFDQFISFSET